MGKTRLAYRPIRLVLGAACGLIGGLLFKQLWKTVGSTSDGPDALDEERSWPEVLITAALQAVFAAVKAAVDCARAGARLLTGTRPV
ncbi:DUF4235 domain-containing protein [Streptomyces sp. NPDC059385]|uniref:DUF4235 domain-containing protein n=1 Tax=Streptomyces sp. NPDC059385 TaxID=3346817 RepID=UPI0036B72263